MYYVYRYIKYMYEYYKFGLNYVFFYILLLLLEYGQFFVFCLLVGNVLLRLLNCMIFRIVI